MDSLKEHGKMIKKMQRRICDESSRAKEEIVTGRAEGLAEIAS